MGALRVKMYCDEIFISDAIRMVNLEMTLLDQFSPALGRGGLYLYLIGRRGSLSVSHLLLRMLIPHRVDVFLKAYRCNITKFTAKSSGEVSICGIQYPIIVTASS